MTPNEKVAKRLTDIIDSMVDPNSSTKLTHLRQSNHTNACGGKLVGCFQIITGQMCS